MNKDLNFGLIGCGKIAEKHAKILKGIEGLNLVAVSDISKERAEKYGQMYQVNWYTNFLEMLAKEKLDVVDILTPSGTHAQIGTEVARQKKHLLVEKPIALRLEDADNLIKACKENTVKLFVVKQNRYNLPVQQLRLALDKNRFGKLVLGSVKVRWCRRQDYYDRDAWRGTWSLDGGVFANQAIHHIDLLQWMMGPVESVVARASTRLSEIEAEDVGVGIFKFKNGALGVIEATTCARPVDLEASISILGEKGAVEIEGFAVNKLKTWNFQDKSPDDDEVITKYTQNPPDIYAFGHMKFFEGMVDSIRNDIDNSVSGFEARKSLELVSALYESIETEREVFLDDFIPQYCKLGRL